MAFLIWKTCCAEAIISHQALISFQQDTLLGVDTAAATLDLLADFLSIEAISSVYKRYLNNRNEDINSELVFVFLAKIKSSPIELASRLGEVSSKSSKNKFELLSFDNDVSLDPDQLLPHPKLVQDITFLRCAAEIVGHYQHPIMKKTMGELLQSISTYENVEFFSQGELLK